MNDQISQGRAAEAVLAAVSVSFTDIVDCQCRLEALIAISREDSFALLAGSFKRVMNMVKKLKEGLPFEEKLLVEEAEKTLYENYLKVRQEALPHLEARNYQGALGEFLRLKPFIDRFFDEVFVMVEDEALRNNRLALLQKIASLFLSVADLSFLREETP